MNKELYLKNITSPFSIKSIRIYKFRVNSGIYKWKLLNLSLKLPQIHTPAMCWNCHLWLYHCLTMFTLCLHTLLPSPWIYGLFLRFLSCSLRLHSMSYASNTWQSIVDFQLHPLSSREPHSTCIQTPHSLKIMIPLKKITWTSS